MSRIMIISWKWQSSHKGEWKVKQHPKDRVYCFHEGEESKSEDKELLQIAQKHLQGGDDVYIFLHRSNYYNTSDVRRLIEKLNEKKQGKLKCFLFSDGRDYIYAGTQKEGLLGTGGVFGIVGKEKVVDESEDFLLKEKFFEKVWKYYKNEFKSKFFSLKEDLLIHFFPLHKHTVEEDAKNLYQHLKKNELLQIRLMSMCEMELLEKEEKLITEAEKTRQVSYIFDDCTTNVQEIYGNNVSKLYTELKKKSEIFLNAPKGEKAIPNKELENLQVQFDNLLSEMPEATFY